MIEQDTVKLLRECDSGARMGVTSIDEVRGRVQDREFRKHLEDCREEHQKLEEEIQRMLGEYHDDGKEPNPVAKGMSWIKTNMKMSVNPSDATVADLLTDGCNMGIKSLHRYLNQYKAADPDAKDICRQLVSIEEQLCRSLRDYL